MTDESVAEFIKEVENLTDKIWEKPPAKIKNMRETQEIALMRPFFKINYSFHNLRALLEELGTLKDCTKNGVLIDCLKSVTIALIESKCAFQEAIGLADTVQLLRKACKVVAKVDNAHDYMAIVDKLFIYLGKMSDRGWLDLEMHWSEVSSAHDIVDSLK
jgi:hypothetical protein